MRVTVKALELLDKYDLPGTIMFTLTGENKDELIPLMNYVANNTKAKGIAFDLVCVCRKRQGYFVTIVERRSEKCF
ncbi:MAG: hypothetical protein ACLU00_00850 [Mediterraneibacter faecis]